MKVKVTMTIQRHQQRAGGELSHMERPRAASKHTDLTPSDDFVAQPAPATDAASPWLNCVSELVF